MVSFAPTSAETLEDQRLYTQARLIVRRGLVGEDVRNDAALDQCFEQLHRIRHDTDRHGLTAVACLDCLARVGVKKNSDHHTSIQWTAEALDSCAEFRKRASEPGGRHVHETCSRLRSSIERAVADGQVEIGALDGY